jgi:hypothetical protein
MRKAVNENPVVQVVLLGILGIVVGLLFMTRIMGGSESGGAVPPAETATSTSTVTTSTTPTTAPSVAPADPAVAGDTTTAPPSAPTGTPGFEAGKGLPAPVVSAYDDGDVVALLVVQKEGTEDRKLETEIQSVRSRGDTAVFVVESDDVARYSRIAEGVKLDRVPALVVIHPKKGAGASLPTASISYGFRGAESVEQAIRDALYKGKQLPYHPG